MDMYEYELKTALHYEPYRLAIADRGLSVRDAKKAEYMEQQKQK